MEPYYDTVPDFSQEKSLVWIEYPGIVKDASKMMETLGGQKNITGTYLEENKRIDLRFRPDDPCCHAVCGDRTEVNGLLLKVKKYRRKKTSSDSTDELRYCPQIVGVVETGYKFNALCDFQYLPLHKDVQKGELVDMIPHLKVKDLDDNAYTKDVPLFLPPATFSRFDQQQDVLFRSAPKYKEMTVNPNKISVTRPRRAHFAQYLKFEENWTPKEPLPAAREALDKITKTEDALVMGIRKLFDHRPIWSKNAISFLLDCTHERLKNVLPALAYYFITGPWRSLWVKFGYDPRKDPDASKFQLLDFRVRQGTNTPHIPIKAKRSTLTYRLPNLMPRAKLGASNLVNNLDEKNPGKLKSKKPTEAVYIFRPGVLPEYRQMFYQICDVCHPSVMEIIQKHTETGLAKECDVKSGWYPKDMASNIRDILSQDIQKTISNTAGIEQPILNMERSARKRSRMPKTTDSTSEKVNENPEMDSFQETELDFSNDEEQTSGDDEQEDLLSEDEVDEDEINDEEAGDSVLENDDNRDINDYSNLSGTYFDDEVDDLTNFLDDFDTYSPGDFDETSEGL